MVALTANVTGFSETCRRTHGDMKKKKDQQRKGVMRTAELNESCAKVAMPTHKLHSRRGLSSRKLVFYQKKKRQKCSGGKK